MNFHLPNFSPQVEETCELKTRLAIYALIPLALPFPSSLDQLSVSRGWKMVKNFLFCAIQRSDCLKNDKHKF